MIPLYVFLTPYDTTKQETHVQILDGALAGSIIHYKKIVFPKKPKKDGSYPVTIDCEFIKDTNTNLDKNIRNNIIGDLALDIVSKSEF